MRSDYVSLLASECRELVRRVDDDPIVGKVVRGTANTSEYRRFLIASYQYVRWSGSLLAGCAAGLRASGRCQALLGLLEEKAREEGPHDAWILADLQSLGESRASVEAEPVSPAIESYRFWSDTLTSSGSPGFLGAAYALEFVSAQRASLAARNLRAQATIPNVGAALSFLEGHGEADLGHLAMLETHLGAVRDERDRRDIRMSAQLLCQLYPRFFEPARRSFPPIGDPGNTVELESGAPCWV